MFLISDMDDHIYDDRDALVEDHLKMLGFNDLNDVRIKLCDGEIITNKDTLMARKDYFAKLIWDGELEWQEKIKDSDEKITHKVKCTVATFPPDVRFDNWPAKLIMQLIPRSLLETIGGQYFWNSKSVFFRPQECESLVKQVKLTNVLGTGFAECVHFTGVCDIKVLILLYNNDMDKYQGFIPNDPVSFVERIRTVIQEEKNKIHNTS